MIIIIFAVVIITLSLFSLCTHNKKIVHLKKIAGHFHLLIQHVADNCQKWLYFRIGQDELTLAPRVQKDGTYNVLKHRLEQAYRNKGVWNIAIIGGAGVGKTSFVKTYETEHTLPFCKYLYLSIGDCNAAENLTDLSEDAVENYILKQIIAHVHYGELPEMSSSTVPERKRKPILSIIISVLTLGILGLALTTDQWSTIVILEKRDLIKSVMCILAIAMICIVVLIFLIKKGNRYGIKSIKLGLDGSSVEFSSKDKLSLERNSDEVIYALESMRWKIGHTVVIEDMELLGDEMCLKLFGKLKLLNKNLNNHISRYRFFDISGIRRPVRFLYLYRDNMTEKMKNDKFFQEIIPVPDRIGAYNIENKINALLQKGAKKRKHNSLITASLNIELQYLFMLSEYLTNYRTVYSIIKDFFSSWDIFIQRLEEKNISSDDAKRLFSFTMYSHIFPDDRKKFNSKECLALSIKDRNSLDACIEYNMHQKDLLWYLVKECPEAYRINYLCKRFLNIDFNKVGQYYVEMKKNISAEQYVLALHYVELAICCEPDNAEYYRSRIKILKSLDRYDETSFDVFQEERFKGHNRKKEDIVSS